MPLARAICLALCALAACGPTAAPEGDRPLDETPPGNDPRPEDEPEEGFDPSDPRAYRWTARVLTFGTLPILYGAVGVEYEWLDPDGELVSRRSLEPGTVLVEKMTFDRLIDGSLRLVTFRTEDRLAMSGCERLVGGGNAIASHDAILAGGYPELEPGEDLTDPGDYREQIRALPGVVMLIDGDCATPDPENPTEDRSVLSWLAITFEAEPDPALIDPDNPPDISGGISGQ